MDWIVIALIVVSCAPFVVPSIISFVKGFIKGLREK